MFGVKDPSERKPSWHAISLHLLGSQLKLSCSEKPAAVELAIGIDRSTPEQADGFARLVPLTSRFKVALGVLFFIEKNLCRLIVRVAFKSP